MRTSLCVVCCFAFGCGSPEPVFVPPGPVDRVVRPAAVTVSAFPAQTFALPSAWASLQVAQQSQLTLLGSDTGLFELTASGTLEPRGGPALGLLTLADGAVLVSKSTGLFEWRDGQLRTSQWVDAAIPFDRLLARQGEVVWLAQGSALLRFDGTRTLRVQTPAPVTAMQVTATSTLATLSGPTGHWLLSQTAAGFQLQSVDAERAGLTHVVPWGAQDVLGLGPEGTLWRRLVVDGATVWRRVALSADPTDPGAQGLTFLFADVDTGSVVTGDDTTLYRLVGDQIFTQPLAAALRQPQLGPNAVLWGLTAGAATRIGRTDPVTFSGRVAAVNATHCVRCHAPGRQGGFSLETAADWRARIDPILTATTPIAPNRARMPADTLTTMTDEERTLIRRWKEDGLP